MISTGVLGVCCGCVDEPLEAGAVTIPAFFIWGWVNENWGSTLFHLTHHAAIGIPPKPVKVGVGAFRTGRGLGVGCGWLE